MTDAATAGPVRRPIRLLDGRYAVVRFSSDHELPPRALRREGASLVVVSWTPDETSLVCPEERVPEGGIAETGWRCVKVVGPMDFSLVGMMAALTSPLARRGISVLALSTYDTDYLLIKEPRLDEALGALEAEGFERLP